MGTRKGLTRGSWDPHSEIFMENAAKCHTNMCRQKDEGNPFGSPFCKIASTYVLLQSEDYVKKLKAVIF